MYEAHLRLMGRLFTEIEEALPKLVRDAKLPAVDDDDLRPCTDLERL